MKLKENIKYLYFIFILAAGGVVFYFREPLSVAAQNADPDEFVVIVAKSQEDYKINRLKDLLPEGFGPENVAGS